MTDKDQIINEYFDWIYDMMCGIRYSKQISYKKLLMHLHSIPFIYSIPRDSNRASDGVGLRRRFALSRGYTNIEEYLDGPCSVLEMMVALSIRCEESIMDEPTVGDRTSQWFWGMIVNLGLGSMIDSRYDAHVVDEIINRFMYREYEPDGKGGLFRIPNCEQDLRTVEIWYQLCWYLDRIM